MIRCDSQYRWGRLEIPSRPEYAAAVRRTVERLGAEAGLTPAEAEDLDLSVTEACANAIRHGSPEQGRNTIRVTFFLAPECILVEVRDEGHGFQAGQSLAPLPGELREGGYGLHIMRQLMDDVEITWHGGTVVRLMKRRGRRAPQEALPRPLAAISEPLPAFA